VIPALALASAACRGRAPASPDDPPDDPAHAIANAPVDAAPLSTSDSLDMRPASSELPVPDGDVAPHALPDDVPAEVPPDGWWKKKGTCPKGSKLRTHGGDVDGVTWRGYVCEGAVDARPFTDLATGAGATDREEGWLDATGRFRGAFRAMRDGWERSGVFVDDLPEGKQLERSPDGEERFTYYRAGVQHGESYEHWNATPLHGYYRYGKRVGTWDVVSLDRLVIARLSYRDGVLHGEQRWWHETGAVLARGTFTDDAGRWEIFDPDGRLLSRLDCDGAKVVEMYAWDANGNVTVHACDGCTDTVGPTDWREQRALGADDILCERPDVQPLIDQYDAY
jgi:hypothetical protein